MRALIFWGSAIIFAAAAIAAAYRCLLDLRWIKLKFRFQLNAGKILEDVKNKYLLLPKNVQIILNISFILLVSRICMYMISYWGYRIYGGEQIDFFNMFETTWSNLADTPRYLQIAQEGYLSDGDYYKMINIVFFPLYPFLIYLAAFFLRNYFYAGIFVSYAALIAACYYFYKLLLLDYDEDLSVRAVKYFLIYPFSIFLSAVYSESLFAALIFIFFYYIRTKKWMYAAAAGFAAGLCRTQGVLLIIPMAYEIVRDITVRQRIHERLHPGKNKRARGSIMKIKKFLKLSYMSILLVPMGFGLYLMINKFVTGDFFTFYKYQKEYWMHEFGLFPYALIPHYDQIIEYNGPLQIYFNAPQILMFFVAVSSVLFFAKKIKPSYLLYSIAYIFVSYGVVGEAGLLSGPRYLIALFPMFISAALITRNKFLDKLLSYFCILFSAILVIMLPFDRGIV